jgi:tetrahydromethanopterin S-methyltransferase subunit F
VLAALFGTTLAPIAGRFGWHWGLVAGFVHSSVVQTVGQLHGGLVLYNNGFAAGLVAAVLLPVILALRSAEQDKDAAR